MHWLQLQSTPCEALQVFESALLDCILKLAVIPVCLCTFSYPNSSFQSTLHFICFDTALLEQPPLSVMTFCDLPSFVEGVNVRLLDHCQVSSLPHYCEFKEQEIPRIYTVWMVIYWTLKCKYSNINPSKVHHTVNTHPEQWAAIYAVAPGEQLGVVQGHLSRGIYGGESAVHSLPPPTIPCRT